MKQNITSMIKDCCFKMNGFQIGDDLNIIPICSYDILIEIDWMELHFFILNCHEKTISCLDENNNSIQIKGVLRPVFVR